MFSLALLDGAAGLRTFLAGEENVLVRAALRIVSEADRDHLPLVLCGPTGVGKTLLAEGLAAAWLTAQQSTAQQATAQPAGDVLRLTAVDFARSYADACDTNSIQEFRSAADPYGLVLVDAVHFLVEKPRAAREFCYQLDQWPCQGKVVVCTSQISPIDLANSGLASRLSGGLVLPLALPSLDTRRELLSQFADERHFELSQDLIEQLAGQLQGSVTKNASPRDLQAAVVQVEATARLTGCAVNSDLIQSFFKTVTADNDIEFKRILAVVGKRFGFTADELRGSYRGKSLVRARGVAILLARRLTGESLQALGKMLGKRDHSTVHHALETIEAALHTDNALRQLVDELQAELSSVQPAKAKRRTAKPTLQTKPQPAPQ